MPESSQDDEEEQNGLENNLSVLSELDNGIEKENASSDNPPQRNKLSRRERSSRIVTHRKPFTVDIRTFGSLLDGNVLGKSKKPQDVHAFWEAADERDASNAIMDKLKGNCEERASGTTGLRRLGARRKNSQRATTRLKRFAVELPLYTEQVQQLDQEDLEEEDITEESSFTFCSNLDFRALNQALQQEDTEKQVQGLLSSQNPKAVDVVHSNEICHAAQDNLDILSAGKSPADTLNMEETAFECRKDTQSFEMPDAAQDLRIENFGLSSAAIDLKKIAVEKSDAVSLSLMSATPNNGNTASKQTSLASPTPPSNPLAVFELRKKTAVEDMSKRKLEFHHDIDALAPELDLVVPAIQNPLQHLSEAAYVSALEETLESPDLIKEAPVSPVSAEGTYPIEQTAMKPFKGTSKRKKTFKIRRNSLEDAGLVWEKGQRRSTRIKSRPLEWWRGERFLVGRIHKSLATVIGIKYTSPPTCWSKRGTMPPKFKVKSFVSEEYAKYVQFAALH